MYISPESAELTFIESATNVAKYFLYFDHSYFIYTGGKGLNRLIMRYEKEKLAEYVKNDLEFVQRFAGFAHH